MIIEVECFLNLCIRPFSNSTPDDIPLSIDLGRVIPICSMHITFVHNTLCAKLVTPPIAVVTPEAGDATPAETSSPSKKPASSGTPTLGILAGNAAILTFVFVDVIVTVADVILVVITVTTIVVVIVVVVKIVVVVIVNNFGLTKHTA